jgi:hypothetical protein
MQKLCVAYQFCFVKQLCVSHGIYDNKVSQLLRVAVQTRSTESLLFLFYG